MNTATIIAAKSRVAPLKTLTILRLELLAALLLSRLIHSVASALKDEIQPGPPVCFTDSKITLCWIQHIGKEWKQFVENNLQNKRSGLSQQLVSLSGDTQSADLPSRGLYPTECEEKQRSSGYKDQIGFRESLCLESNDEDLVPDECLTELSNSSHKTVTLSVTNTNYPDQGQFISPCACQNTLFAYHN